MPETLVTNDPNAVREFAAALGDVVMKPLAMPAVQEAGGPSLLYTVKLTRSDLAGDVDSVRSTAHLFQRWIEPKYAARVTVIGSVPFAVAIYARSESARIDWRSDYAAVSYEVIHCPAAVGAAMARYLKVRRLRFGAFDFVVDRNDQWWFLECNSSGQWAWLAEECQLPITEAIVAELLGKG